MKKHREEEILFQIALNKIPMKSNGGIYFLYSGEEIVYIDGLIFTLLGLLVILAAQWAFSTLTAIHSLTQ